MSTEVENKVVSMTFDNSRFERNISKTLQSLSNLKKSLSFKGAVRGIQTVSEQLGEVDLSKLDKAAELVNNRFSTMGIIGTTALVNITNKAIDAGLALANNLTIRPLREGLQEYNLKMNSIKTIMSSTGKPVEEVNRQLALLNEYSDKTIYSFKDMTDNISKFTNNGVELEDSVTAIKGVAQVAALSGANANEASRAMYNFSQALSTGTVKVIDWKSIENANMATKQFKNTILETAAELGELEDLGDGFYSGINEKGKEFIVNSQSFREELNNGFFTSEVLTKSLAKFTDETTELGQAAYSAASDIRTFGTLMDVTYESIGSGWAYVFEAIVGNLEEATTLWNGISNSLNGFISGKFERIQAVLQGWKERGGRNTMLEGLANIFGTLSDVMGSVSDAFRDVFGYMDSMKLYNITVKFRDFTEAIRPTPETLENIRAVARPLFRVIKAGLDVLGFGFKIAGKFIGFLSPVAKKVLSVAASFSQFAEDVYKAIEKTWFFQAIIEGLFGVFDSIGEVFSSIGEGFSDMLNTDTFKPLMDFINMVRNFFSGGDDGVSNFSDKLYNFFMMSGPVVTQATTAISDFINGMKEMIPFTAKDIGGTFAKGFGGLAYVLSSIDWTNIAGELHKQLELGKERSKVWIDTIIKYAGDIPKILKDFWNNIPSFKEIKEDVGSFTDKVSELFEKLGNNKIISAITNSVGNIGRAFKDLAFDGDWLKFIQAIQEIFKGGILWEILKIFREFGKQTGYITKAFRDTTNSLKESLNGFALGVKADALMKIAIAVGILAAAIALLAYMDSEKVAVGIGAVMTSMTGLVIAIKSIQKLKFEGSFQDIFKIGLSMIFLASAMVILASAVTKFKGMEWDEMAMGLTAVTALLIELVGVSTLIQKTGLKFQEGGFQLIFMAGAVWILADALTKFKDVDAEAINNGVNAITIAMIMFTGMGAAISKFQPKMIRFAIGIAILAGSLYLLGLSLGQIASMDMGALQKGLGGVMIALAAFAAASILSENMVKLGVGLAAAAIGLRLILQPLKDFATMTWEQLLKGLLAFTGIMIGMVAPLKSLTRVSKHALKGAGGILAVGVALKLVAPVFEHLGTLDWATIIKGLVAVGGLMVEMTIPMGAMGAMGKGVLSASLGIMAMATAIKILTPAFKELGGMKFSNIVKGLIAVAGVFAVIGGAAYFIGPLIPSIFGLSVAMMALSAALFIAGSGVALFAGGIYALGKAMNSGIEGFAKNLSTMASGLADAVIIFLDGLFVQGRGVLTDTVASLIIVLCNAIMDSIPAIVQVITAVIDALLTQLLPLIPHIVDVMLNFIIEILNKLSEKLPEIVAAAQPVWEQLVCLFAALPRDSLLKSIGVVAGIAILVKMLSTLKIRHIGKATRGLANISIMLAELTAVFVAFGLISKIPYVTELLEGGGELLVTVAKYLGEFVGSLIGGLAEGISNGLPGIGENLSSFMTNMEPFFEGLRNIKQEDIDALDTLTEALLKLTASELLDGIANLLGAEGGLEGFAKELAASAGPFKQYAEEINSLPPGAAEKSAIVADSIAALMAAMPKEGGVWQWLAGENAKLSDVAKQLALAAPDFVKYGDEIKNLDTNAVSGTTSFVESIIALAGKTPGTNGVWQWLAGENVSLVSVASDLADASPYFKDYGDNIKGLDTDAVAGTQNMVSAMIELTRQTNDKGGWWQTLTGEKESLASIGENLFKFAIYYKLFSDKMAEIPDELIDRAKGVVEVATQLATKVPEEGFWEMLGADSDLETFGQNLVSFADYFVKFSKSMTEGVDVGLLTDTVREFGKLVDITKRIETIDQDVVAEFGDTMEEIADVGIEEFVDAFEGSVVDVKTAVSEFMDAAKESIESKKEHFQNSITFIIDAVEKTAKSGSKTKYTKMGGYIVTNMSLGMVQPDKVKQIQGSVSEIIEFINETFKNNEGTLIKNGKYISAGLAKGIKRGTPWVTNSVMWLSEQIKRKFQQEFDIHSPSRYFEWGGEMFDDGLAKGVIKNAPVVSDALSSMKDKSLEKFKMEAEGEKEGKGLIKGLASGMNKNKLDLTKVAKGLSKDAVKHLDLSYVDEMKKKQDTFEKTNFTPSKQDFDTNELTYSDADFETPYTSERAEQEREKRWDALNDEGKLQIREKDALRSKMAIKKIVEEMKVDSDKQIWRQKEQARADKFQKRDDSQWEQHKVELDEKVVHLNKDIEAANAEIAKLTDPKKLQDMRDKIKNYKSELDDTLWEIDDLGFQDESRVRDKKANLEAWEQEQLDFQMRRDAALELIEYEQTLSMVKQADFKGEKLDLEKKIAELDKEIETLEQQKLEAQKKKDKDAELAIQDKLTKIKARNDAEREILKYIEEGGEIQEMQINQLTDLATQANVDEAEVKWGLKGQSIVNSFSQEVDAEAMKILTDTGRQMLKYLAKGFNEQRPQFLQVSKVLTDELSEAFEKKYTSYRAIGGFIARQIASGLESNAKLIYDEAKRIADEALSAAMAQMNDELEWEMDRLSDEMEEWTPSIKPVVRMDSRELDKLSKFSDVSVEKARHISGSRDIGSTTKIENITNNYNYKQNNYSPKSLNTAEIYRRTNNQMSRLKRKVGS